MGSPSRPGSLTRLTKLPDQWKCAVCHQFVPETTTEPQHRLFECGIVLPDSGVRTHFETGAVRDASVDKGLPSCIPPEAIRRLAIHYERGARKYALHNWMKGIPLSRYFDAIVRHALAAAEGKTEEDHLAAVLWNAAGWLWTQAEIEAGRLPAELNDLPYYTGPRPPKKEKA